MASEGICCTDTEADAGYCDVDYCCLDSECTEEFAEGGTCCTWYWEQKGYCSLDDFDYAFSEESLVSASEEIECSADDA